LLVSSAANLPLNKPTASGSFDGARVGAGAAVGSLQVISSRPAASVSALIFGSEAEVTAALVSSSGTQVISTTSSTFLAAGGAFAGGFALAAAAFGGAIAGAAALGGATTGAAAFCGA
jgi:hypothetical protein